MTNWKVDLTIRIKEVANMNNRIKELRAKHNITQEQLAASVGITRQSLILIEKGETVPSGDTMLKIAKCLQKPAEEIFFEDNVRQA